MKNKSCHIAVVALMAVLLSGCSSLVGTWRLEAPDISSRTVNVVSLGENKYYFQVDGEKFAGTYHLEKPLVVMEKPELPRLSGYRWRWDGKRKLTLIDEAPFTVSQQRYMPATLTKQ